MDKPEVAAALQEYEDAMAEFLTSVRARDTRSDFPLRQRLYAAGVEIERLRLRGTPAYNDGFCALIEIHGPLSVQKAALAYVHAE